MSGILMIITAAVIFGFAVYNIACYVADVPTMAASHLLSAPRHSGHIGKLEQIFERFIKLDEMKRSELERALRNSKLDKTPEQFVVSIISRAKYPLLISLPVLFVMPLIGIIGIAAAVIRGFLQYQEVIDKDKKRRRRIERDIPKLTSAVAQGLRLDRDIFKILNSYRNNAEPEMADELGQTIADMRTGSYESALMNLQDRIGSSMLSEVVRGLMGVLRGDDQQMYFEMLKFQMRQLEQSNLRNEAMKRPRKMQRYSMIILGLLLLIYGVVFATQIMTSIGGLF